MSSINQITHFNRMVSLASNTMELQDLELVEAFLEALANRFGTEFASALLTAAVLQLAETDSDTCDWVLQNLYDPEAYAALSEGTRMFIVQELLRAGFALGKDFSVTHLGKLLLNEAATIVLENASALDRLLLQDILQVV